MESKHEAKGERKEEQEEEQQEEEDDDDDDEGYKASSSSSPQGGEAKHGRDEAAAGAKDVEEEDDLLRKVFDYYYEDEDLEKTLRTWAFDHAEIFDEETRRRGEYSLEHTRRHDAFRRLFEDKVEAYLRAQGADVPSFYRTIAADQARSTELYSGHTFAAVINSTMSFDAFYDLMADAKRGDFYWGIPLLQDMDTLEFLF